MREEKLLLEVIGAVVVTTVLLGLPILSFVSFVYNWHGFFMLCFTMGLLVDFFYILSMLLKDE